MQFEDTRESMQAFCVGQYMEVCWLGYTIFYILAFGAVKTSLFALPVSCLF